MTAGRGGDAPPVVGEAFGRATPKRGLIRALVSLARPRQWSKSVFCLIGPAYGWFAIQDSIDHGATTLGESVLAVVLCAASFALASSGCYVINDLMDAEADRLHPRKRSRPIAAGQVNAKTAVTFAVALWASSVACAALAPSETRWLVILAVGLHVGNVLSYSFFIKHAAIADVMSLAMGFVLRVMGGCAAAGVEPSVWLLNVTFFLSMFLAFGKRLGERRVMAKLDRDGDGSLAVRHRRVQSAYSDVFLQMAVVVTGVTTLVTYAFYIQSREDPVIIGFSLLWLTMLPSTYGLLRAIVTLENGRYDDPTELAFKDRAFQVAGAAFVALTVTITILATHLPEHPLNPDADAATSPRTFSPSAPSTTSP